MKYAKLLLVLMCMALLACDSTVDPAPDGLVLSSVRHETGDQSWLQLFSYDAAGRLLAIEDQTSYGRNQNYSYQGDHLAEIRNISRAENQVIFIDSLFYNANGLLNEVHNYSINEGADLPLNSITYLTYNSQGLLKERSTVYERETDYNPRDIYYWQDGNVVQLDRYNGDSKLQEYYYTYDNKPAVDYDLWQLTGVRYVTNQNNIVSTDWTDYTGLLDTACKPCSGTYSYYANGLPATYTTNWGYQLTFEFKELPRTTEQ